MIDQFVIFRPTGQVEFNYQPGKNLSSVTSALINDVLISDRKLKTYSELEKEEAYANEEDHNLDEEDVNNVLGTYSYDSYIVT